MVGRDASVCPSIDQVELLENATSVVNQVSKEINNDKITEEQVDSMEKARIEVETIEKCPNDNFKASVGADPSILTNATKSVESAQQVVEAKTDELQATTSDEPNLALIIGASVGGFVALVIIIAIIVYCVRKNQKKKKGNQSTALASSKTPQQDLWINKSPAEDGSPSNEKATPEVTKSGGNSKVDEQARSGQPAMVLTTFQTVKETSTTGAHEQTVPKNDSVNSQAVKQPLPSSYPNEGKIVDRPTVLPLSAAYVNRAYDVDAKDESSRSDTDFSPRPAHRRPSPNKRNRDSDYSSRPDPRRAPNHGRYPRQYNDPHRRSRSDYDYDRPHRDQRTDREYRHRHQSSSPGRYQSRPSRPRTRPTSVRERDMKQPSGPIPRLPSTMYDSDRQDRSQRSSRHSTLERAPRGYGRTEPTTRHSNGHKSERNHPPSEYRRREPEYKSRTSHRSPEPRPFSYTSQDDRRPGNNTSLQRKSGSRSELDKEINMRKEFRRPYSYQDLY
ncbi:serine/arginine repetitive matrix protein 1 [Hyalella azteca]|uniref:Serine/arginine repetitive matrix protein 1 n=1 Tax=Hyalella azteca TaxID=294128 RepID=A0A8B7PCF1_HYAAZ|nr:serine/arginine repetitive matrix protein 1 [Hyalella azteca]